MTTKKQVEEMLVDGKSLVKGKLHPRLMKGAVYGYEITYNDLPLLIENVIDLIAKARIEELNWIVKHRQSLKGYDDESVIATSLVDARIKELQ